MGKQRCRKKKVSHGLYNSISKMSNIVNEAQANLNKVDAWLKGKNPWLCVQNTSGNTKERYIRVKSNDYWGNPRGQGNKSPKGNYCV